MKFMKFAGAISLGLLILAMGSERSRVQAADDKAAQDAELFATLDGNSDGQLTSDEIAPEKEKFFSQLVIRGDSDKDGSLTQDEFVAALNEEDSAPEEAKTDEAKAEKKAAKKKGKNAKKKAAKEGKGKGKQAKGRKMPTPEAIIKRLDKDDDGKLTGDEVPERMKRMLKEGETEITVEVLKANFEKRKARMEKMADTGKKPAEGRPAPERRGFGRPPMQFEGGLLNTLDTNDDKQLSKEELEAVSEKFAELDTDNDGQISIRELMGKPKFGPGMRPDARKGEGPAGKGKKDKKGKARKPGKEKKKPNSDAAFSVKDDGEKEEVADEDGEEKAGKPEGKKDRKKAGRRHGRHHGKGHFSRGHHRSHGKGHWGRGHGHHGRSHWGRGHDRHGRSHWGHRHHRSHGKGHWGHRHRGSHDKCDCGRGHSRSHRGWGRGHHRHHERGHWGRGHHRPHHWGHRSHHRGRGPEGSFGRGRFSHMRHGHHRFGGFKRPSFTVEGGLLNTLDANDDKKLSEEELSSITEKFAELDKDGDGQISIPEMIGKFKFAGHHGHMKKDHDKKEKKEKKTESDKDDSESSESDSESEDSESGSDS